MQRLQPTTYEDLATVPEIFLSSTGFALANTLSLPELYPCEIITKKFKFNF